MQKWFRGCRTRSGVCRCVTKPWNNSKLSQTCRGESLIFKDSPLTKRQSFESKDPATPGPKKARTTESIIKAMLIYSWCEGHSAHRILSTGPGHQQAHLQESAATFDAASAKEETTTVQKIMGALQEQYLKHREIPFQK